MSLDQHSEETRDQARGLIEQAGPAIPRQVAEAVVRAAYVHDIGKCHPIWQDALCAVASDETRDEVERGRPWAKSGIEAPLMFRDDVAFRHELASLLLLDGPLAGLLVGVGDADLVRYLALAHHGKLRVRVSDFVELSTGEGPTRPAVLLGLVHGETTVVPAFLGRDGGTLTVDLSPFAPDGDRSWARTVSGLLGRYGPFVLAYLETLVRIADWRASAGLPVPPNGGTGPGG
jgi:CRISPR-associated endonuclease/helicase Cas3